MPFNSKGGKGYKKKKKVTSDVMPSVNFVDKQEGQMVARAIRLLGNRNVLCFCNDNVLRICHICGRMKGRCWIEPGDILLVSLREFTSEEALQKGRGSEPMRGDIIAKYVPEQLSSLRKDPDVNQKLFMKLETIDGMTLEEVGVDKTMDKKLNAEDDFGFVFDSGGAEPGNTVVDSKKGAVADDEDVNIDDI
jgi:translation initiation factor 1A